LIVEHPQPCQWSSELWVSHAQSLPNLQTKGEKKPKTRCAIPEWTSGEVSIRRGVVSIAETLKIEERPLEMTSTGKDRGHGPDWWCFGTDGKMEIW
jgi:hypothetical protein